MNKLLAFTLLLSSFQPLFARDIVSKHSKNAVKVELETNNGNKLIRFSYCKDKAALDKCELLGEGLYKIEDIENFKTIQKVKLVANGLAATLALPAGAMMSIGGSVAAFTGVGAIVAVGGMATVAGGLKAGAWLFDNAENLENFHSSVISDEEVVLSDLLEFEVSQLKKEPNTLENRKEMEKLLDMQAATAYRRVKDAAVNIETNLLRLDVAVNER